MGVVSCPLPGVCKQRSAVTGPGVLPQSLCLWLTVYRGMLLGDVLLVLDLGGQQCDQAGLGVEDSPKQARKGKPQAKSGLP